MKRLYLFDFLPLIAGVMLTFSFAPFSIYPLAIISPALLLMCWIKVTPARAFWRGFLFGIGLFTSGVYWIYISIHTFGNTAPPVALITTGGLIAILALFPAFNGLILNRFFPCNLRATTPFIFAFSVIWVLLEWVRSWLFSGFPWLLIGYSQMTSPLRGYAPIFSVYGLSLAVVLSSALIINAVIKHRQSHRKQMLWSIATITLIWLIGFALSFITWTKPFGKPMTVSLVQGNVAQELKWSPEQVDPIVQGYLKLTQSHWNSQIIVWPESAIPSPLQHAETYLNLIGHMKKPHTTFITGIPAKAPDRPGYYNAVISLDDERPGIYTKQRLVPFGEYIPMRDIFGKVFDILQVPMSDFIPGNPTSKPIYAGDVQIAVFICYEIAYPEQVQFGDNQANMLLTVSNDAWFGKSIAQAQHLEIAQMRALEVGRPILFGSNDGITAIINDKGYVQSAAPQYEAYVLTDKVQPTQGKTPWQRFSMDPILGILLILLGVAIWRQRKKS